jgi:hypothetical protein
MVLLAPKFETSNWVAWEVNLRDKLKGLLVTGNVTLPTPGYIVFLDKAIPQGIIPTQLILRLTIVKLPGKYPQQVTTQPVLWENVDEPDTISYDSVSIRLPDGTTKEIDVILKDLPRNESDELTIYFAPPLSDAGTGSSAVGSNFLARYEKEIASGITWVETIDSFPFVRTYRGDVWVTLDHPRIDEITGAISDSLVESAIIALIAAVAAGILTGGGAIPGAAIAAFQKALVLSLSAKGVGFAGDISVNLEIRNKR